MLHGGRATGNDVYPVTSPKYQRHSFQSSQLAKRCLSVETTRIKYFSSPRSLTESLMTRTCKVQWTNVIDRPSLALLCSAVLSPPHQSWLIPHLLLQSLSSHDTERNYCPILLHPTEGRKMSPPRHSSSENWMEYAYIPTSNAHH